MELNIFATSEEASAYAAQLIIDQVKKNPQTVLGLATGSTPEQMYQNMIHDHKEKKTSYEQVVTYNLDEYIGLAETHPQSYRYFMNEHLFQGIDIPLANTHVPKGTGNAEQNAKEYDELLTKLGGADIQILGIGTNGHIAFNEPGVPFDCTTHVVDLVEATIAANARFFESEAEVPTQAVSMGIASILQAKKIILLAFGESKAAAIQGMFEDAISPALPATALQNHPNVVVVVDEAAASLLNK